MKGSNFFAMLSRMKYIQRWGLMRNNRTENLSEHTLDTVYIAHVLALMSGIDPGRVVLGALYHDCGEIFTGDMPTPIKYYDPQLRESYKKVEEMAAKQLLEMLPEDLREAYQGHFFEEDTEICKLVKAADKLSALIKCLEELRAGNQEFRNARDANLAYLKEMKLPAVDRFLWEFLPAYEMTLDQLSLNPLPNSEIRSERTK